MSRKRDVEDDEDSDRTIKAGPRGETKSEGRTAGKPRPQDSGRDSITQAVWRSESGIDPVVGWLVCHEGANQGRDYRICSGRNTIGRDTSSQISIRGDESISRENHASIFYDRREVAFHIVVENGRTGVYVDGKVGLQPTQLKPYDIVEIGETKLIFVPLCGKEFQWKEKPKDPKGTKGVKTKHKVTEEPPDPDDDDEDEDGGRTVAG